MIRPPEWMPTGMTWWEAVLWTLLEVALIFGVPLGLVALSAPMEHAWDRLVGALRPTLKEGDRDDQV